MGPKHTGGESTEPNFRKFCKNNLQKWKKWSESPGIEPGVFLFKVRWKEGGGAAGGGGGGVRREAGERA